MIKINILGNDIALDTSGPLWAAGFSLSLGIFLLVCFFLHRTTVQELSIALTEAASLEGRLQELMRRTKEVRDLEEKKQELGEKLLVIARLKKSKTGPVRVLDDLNLSIPEKAWLVDVEERAGVFRFNGVALDIHTIANFMRAIERSDYFDDVKLIETKQTEIDSVGMKAFNLHAKVNYAGLTKSETESEAAEESKKS